MLRATRSAQVLSSIDLHKMRGTGSRELRARLFQKATLAEGDVRAQNVAK